MIHHAETGQPLTLTPREAAPMVPMGLRQFYEAVHRGDIPHLRVGKCIRIPRKRFEEWLSGTAA